MGDTNVHVNVNGTTFGGIYEVIDRTVELTSADFGERSEALGDEPARNVAERLLARMVDEAVRRGALFVRDDGTLALPLGQSDR